MEKPTIRPANRETWVVIMGQLSALRWVHRPRWGTRSPEITLSNATKLRNTSLV